MSRPIIVPSLLVAIAVIGMAGAFTARRGDERARKLKDRVAHDDSARSRAVARMDSQRSERRTASASACPTEPEDISEWGAGTHEKLPVVVPVLPDFSFDREGYGEGRISFRSGDGESYSVSYGTRVASIGDWPQYELVGECADMADVMPGTIQTARDKSPDGVMKVVLATYRLPDGNFVSFQGTTRDVERQVQLVAAAHHMRLKR
jgi:hypothetical protein